MRAGTFAAAIAVLIAVVAATASADSGRKPTFAWSGRALKLSAPAPGHVAVGVIKVRAKTAARGAPRPTVAGLEGHPGVVVLLVSHLARSKGYTTRTVLFAIVDRSTRRLADEGYGALTIAADVLFNGPDTALAQLGTALNMSDWTREAKEAYFADKGARRAAARAVREFKQTFDSTDPWTPTLGESAALDTGAYDDGHSFGWKPSSPEPAKDLVRLETRGDDWVAGIDKLLDDLTKYGPPVPGGTTPTPSPQPTYTCTGPNVLLFDNWNTSPAANGGTAPTFDTGGKSYCINETATYHWNGGAGAAPGTISIAQAGKVLAAWQAVGQAPDGSPGDINWVANIPQGSAPVVVKGSFACRDSSPATWAQNAASKHAGFCRVWGQLATAS
jgi:hypothetical protein